MLLNPPSVFCSNSNVHPRVIAAHPQEPNQFAIGLSDGSVHVFEPLESEAKWGAPPPADNGSTSSIPTTPLVGGSTPEQPQRWLDPMIIVRNSRPRNSSNVAFVQWDVWIASGFEVSNMSLLCSKKPVKRSHMSCKNYYLYIIVITGCFSDPPNCNWFFFLFAHIWWKSNINSLVHFLCWYESCRYMLILQYYTCACLILHSV